VFVCYILESVLEMMLSMKAAKEAGKDTNNPPVSVLRVTV